MINGRLRKQGSETRSWQVLVERVAETGKIALHFGDRLLQAVVLGQIEAVLDRAAVEVRQMRSLFRGRIFVRLKS